MVYTRVVLKVARPILKEVKCRSAGWISLTGFVLCAAGSSQINTGKSASSRGSSLRPDQSKTFKTGTFTYTVSRFVRRKLFVNHNKIEYLGDLKGCARRRLMACTRRAFVFSFSHVVTLHMPSLTGSIPLFGLVEVVLLLSQSLVWTPSGCLIRHRFPFTSVTPRVLVATCPSAELAPSSTRRKPEPE
jgi:hypothetical protein